jgi:serine/threonine-protein kinase
MAPEQFQNAKGVGYPADLYAIGVVVFRTLTGRLPFVSRSLEAVIRMKSEQPAPTISSMPGMIQNPLLDWFVQKSMVRSPEARFQSAREMLEQWWNVMASLDEEGSTDIMRIGRVDEPYARRPATAPPPTLPNNPDPADLEERTIQRLHPPAPHHAPRSSTLHETPRSAMASSRPMSSDRTMREEPAPLTVPSHGSAVASPVSSLDDTAASMEPISDQMLEDDPFDQPTRNDPNLRKLVERELELQKARKEGK